MRRRPKPGSDGGPQGQKEKPKSGSKDQEKRLRKLERDLDAKEKEIAALESAIEAAASDYQELTRLLAEKESAEETLLAMMEEWEKAGEG